MDHISHNNLPEAVNELLNKVDNIEKMLLGRSIEHQTETDKLLTVEEAAEFLHLSVESVYALTRKFEIPCYKPNKRLYFSTEKLIEYIKAFPQKTKDEVKAERDDFLCSKKKKINKNKKFESN